MTIHLSIQGKDDEAEQVLTFVRTQFPSLTLSEQRGIIVRALAWMNAVDGIEFGTGPVNARFEDHDPVVPTP